MKPAAVFALALSLALPSAVALAADPPAKPAERPASDKPAGAKAAQPKAAKPAPAKVAAVKGPAKPKGACYSKAEFEAEQGIRFHTELMVIGLTCREAMGPGRDLFADYKRVTLALRDTIVGWERALIAHYKRSGAANPTRSLDNFRTAVANENAQRIASVTAPVYCQTQALQIDRAMALSAAEAKRQVEDAKLVQVAAMQRCDLPVIP